MTPPVLITRHPRVVPRLTRLLRDRGYDLCMAPMLVAQLPEDTRPLAGVMELAATPRVPTWLTVTSANTVLAFGQVGCDGWAPRMEAARRRSPRLHIAAVGRATQAALHKAGLGVDFVPRGSQSAAGMLAEWPVRTVHRRDLALVPASALTPGTLARGLEDRGYTVVRAQAYTMVATPSARALDHHTSCAGDPPVVAASTARARYAAGRFDVVVATAPSRVSALLEGVSDHPRTTSWVAIGESTAARLRQYQIQPIVARDPSAEALARAVDQTRENVTSQQRRTGGITP